MLTTLLGTGGTVEQVQAAERIRLTVELALIRQRTGRAESARHLAEELRDYQRTGRLSGVAVATCAEVLFDLNEHQAARDVLHAEYDRLAADPKRGPDARETLVALHNLAEVHHAAGELEPEETPGGGFTMVISLPAVSRVVPAAPGLRERDEATT